MGLSKAAYSKSALEFDVFQVSLTSGAKTDTDTWQMTDLESQRLIQWNASAATREALLWRKGLSNSCTRVSSDNSRLNCDRSNMNSVKEMWHFLIISHVSGESVRWAGAVVERPREQHQHQHQHRRCLTGLRAPRPPGVQHQAPPALCPPMCTTHQSWMNHSPSSRNQEKTLRTQRRRLKALLPLKSR